MRIGFKANIPTSLGSLLNLVLSGDCAVSLDSVVWIGVQAYGERGYKPRLRLDSVVWIGFKGVTVVGGTVRCGSPVVSPTQRTLTGSETTANGDSDDIENAFNCDGSE